MKSKEVPNQPWYILTVLVMLILVGCQNQDSVDSQTKALTTQSHELRIDHATWDDQSASLNIEGTSKPGDTVSIYEATRNRLIAEAHADEEGEWRVVLNNASNVACVIKARSEEDDEDEHEFEYALNDCDDDDSDNIADANIRGTYQIFSVNDLGMHCMDEDYSVFSVLPPFNTLHAQVIKKGRKPVLMTPASIDVRYRAISDASGSINSTSIGKTNFWQHVDTLFGVSLAPDVGLTGNKMPSEVNGPQAFNGFDQHAHRYLATGIPISPWDDYSQHNSYPLFRVEAFDKTSGQLLTSVDAVVPVSEEMACSDCHHSGGVAADEATSVRYGGVQWSAATKASVQYKENILRLHDVKHDTALFNNQPVLCAECHYSPALDLAGNGPQGLQTSTSFLSYAIHKRHGETVYGSLPSSDTDAIIRESGKTTCYNCHPGKQTQCFRGAMANANLICQDCHGGMLAVGGQYPLKDGRIRQPWKDLPKCQSCHTGDEINHQGGSSVLRLAYDPSDLAATPLLANNKRFAEPDDGFYRLSTGHGGMDCTSCHGSPHAIWPNADPNANDNVAAMQIQGYAGTITECNSCHTIGSLPLALSGPHGMHNVDDPRWTDEHEDFYERDPDSCRSCHGVNLEGTRLSRTATDRTYQLDDDDHNSETIFLYKGTEVSCTLCHERP